MKQHNQHDKNITINEQGDNTWLGAVRHKKHYPMLQDKSFQQFKKHLTGGKKKIFVAQIKCCNVHSWCNISQGK